MTGFKYPAASIGSLVGQAGGNVGTSKAILAAFPIAFATGQLPTPNGSINEGVISKDGKTIFGTSGSNVDQIDLSSAGDPSTGTAVTSISVPNTNGIASDPDGTHFAVIDGNNNEVHYFTCSTPWDLSTASSLSSQSISGGDQTAIRYANDGNALYWHNKGNNETFRAELTTPWNPTTRTNETKTGVITGMQNLVVANDESLLIHAENNEQFFGYMSTPGDLSTLTEVQTRLVGYARQGSNAPRTEAFIYNPKSPWFMVKDSDEYHISFVDWDEYRKIIGV